MPAQNTALSYGSVARSLHWLTALLILAAFPLGWIANNLPYGTSEEVATKAWLFSIHKTLGVTVFFVALARILWALTQTHPVPVHPDRKAESFAAAFVHWLLYASLVVVPLSGWIHHAALDGFAPILWPFGQDLPLVPKSEAVALMSGATHWIFTKLLLATLALHVLGAVKHAVIDRDGVVARMVTGRPAGIEGAKAPMRGPFWAAVAVFLAAGFGAGMIAGGRTAPAPQATAAVEPPVATPAAASGNWQVQEGTLGFSVQQMGQTVEGSFASWTAAITYDEATGAGEVTVSIDTTSLTLGAVTEQAKAAEFFDTATFPTATFTAVLARDGDAHTATGTLTLRGAEQPVTLPFTLVIEGATATMTGETTLDRRDYGMGASYGDETTVGFTTTVKIALTAKRAG